MDKLLKEIRDCQICLPYLEHGVRPVIAASLHSKIVIIGQAPGRIVHNTGIPWNDKSGDNLRTWMGIDKTTFYNEDLFALMPMGFCYPGKGKSGDLAPRKECAPLWHGILLKMIKEKKLILLVGQYAQQHYLKHLVKSTLTETVRHFRDYLPEYFVLPHPSPRNNIWQKKNEWFGKEVLPFLKNMVADIIEKAKDGTL
jgi:uracil-DNA glycosylase